MNALVALLHFCEVHGPCVVFCTQTIHDEQPPQEVKKSSSCAACTAQFPLVNNGQSVSEAKHLLTTDEDYPHIKYMGTKSPTQNHLYKAVRLACVRSLTAEFCQGRDGPVLFGDDENGYVMSYMFKLRDSQARGEARFYSFMMLMTDRVYLISCWPYIVSAFKSMVIHLQERANVVFQKEKELKHQQNPYSISHRRGGAPISQEQFFKRRSHTPLRSLVDLLGIKDIYVQIQAQFSLILKLSSRKRMEKLNPGRSESALYKKVKEEYEAKKNIQKKSA
ncbi:vesicle coat protein [Sporodiniella umbellata]|nr:vesicle coat protein [Sporodiniella umbellata]